MMTKSYPSRRVRWPLLLLLLLFHGLLLLGLNHQRVEPSQTANAVVLRILPPEVPPVPPMPETRTRRVAAFTPSPVYVPVPEVTTTANPNPTVAAAVPSAPASAASAPTRLNLALPTQMLASPRVPTVREQALNDPRTNSSKPTVESRIADAAGTLPIVVTRSADGQSQTIRQGSKCTVVSKPRTAAIDPMDSRLRSLPNEVGGC